MAKTIDVNINVDVDSKSINELENDVKRLEERFKQAKPGTREFEELGFKIKEARTILKDFELQFEALDKEQRATALVNVFAGMADAVAGVAGALSLFGVEGENIEEIEKKMVALLVVTQGIRGAMEAVQFTTQLFGKELSDVGKAIASFVGVGKGLPEYANAFQSAFDRMNDSINLTNLSIEKSKARIDELEIAMNEMDLVTEIDASVFADLNEQLQDEKKNLDILEKTKQSYVQTQDELVDSLDKTTESTEGVGKSTRNLATRFKEITIALGTTALIGAVIYAITNFDELSESLSGVDKEAKKVKDELKETEAQIIATARAAEIGIGTSFNELNNEFITLQKNGRDLTEAFERIKKVLPGVEKFNIKTADGVNKLSAALQRQADIETITNKIKTNSQIIQENIIKQDEAVAKNKPELLKDLLRENNATRKQNEELVLQRDALEKLQKEELKFITTGKDVNKVLQDRIKFLDETKFALREALRQQAEAQTKGEIEIATKQFENRKEALQDQEELEVARAKQIGVLTAEARENIRKKYEALGIIAQTEYQRKLYDIELAWFEKRLDAFKLLQAADKQRNEASEQAAEQTLTAQLQLQRTYLENMIRMTKDEVEKIKLERLKLVGVELEANKNVVKSINDTRDDRIQAAKDARQAAVNAGQTEIMAEKEYQETLITIDNETNKQLEIQAKQHQQNLKAIDLDGQKQITDNRKTKLKEYADYFAETLRILGDLYSNFIDMEAQLSAQRTDRIIEQLERERQARLKQLELESRDVITQSDIRQAQVDKINEEYDKRQRDLEAKQFDYEKQLKTSQTIINGIVGASQIVASQAANPVLMGISLAALAATTAGQVAVIQDQKLPEYAIGGMVEGPGTGTSDSILARLSNGEFVVNAKATQQYLPVLKAINEGKTDMMPGVDPELKQAITQLNQNLQNPMKAYIVQNDLYNSVRSQQQLNNRRKL